MNTEHEQLKSFQYVPPSTRLFSGSDSLSHLQRELERAGSERAVVVCAAPIAQDDGLMGLVRSALGARLAGVFSDVVAHSPTSSVEAATDALREANADSIIAVGGGSAIVTARAAGILLAEKRDVRELCTSRNEKGELQNPKLSAKKLPQFIIPSTPTTAMAKAGAAVYDSVNHERLALFDPKVRALGVFLHPAFAASAPDDLVISSSLNTFSMAIEGLTSRAGNPWSDALESRKTCRRHDLVSNA